MPAKSATCQGQHQDLLGWTEGTGYPNRVYKILWQLKTCGFRQACSLAIIRTRRFLSDHHRGTHAARAGARLDGEVLNLQPGERVKVKSESEILETLDSCGRSRGLAWIPCMAKYCGQECRVYKRVERLILETTGEIRKAKNTVLLDGVICDGLYGCDRSCFPFWREVWLERLPDNASEEPGDDER